MIEGRTHLLELRIVRPLALVSELTARPPAWQHVPGHMVVEIDEARKDDPIGIDPDGIGSVRSLIGDRGDAAAHDAHVAVLNDTVWGEDGAAKDDGPAPGGSACVARDHRSRIRWKPRCLHAARDRDRERKGGEIGAAMTH